MAESIRFVGLDVHATQTCAVILDRDSGELRKARLRTMPLGVIDYLKPLQPLRAVYESGPTGLRLARQAQQQALEVRVCPSGLVPRRPTDRVKTDMRDAEGLARGG